MKKNFILLLLPLFFIHPGCRSNPKQEGPEIFLILEDDFIAEAPLPVPEENPSASSFGEIWAYLVSGREQALQEDLPISDLCYFGAEVDSYGKLVNVPDIRKTALFRGRKHLVVKCDGRALTHFAILEGRPERKQLTADLLSAAEPFNGLQIDFEYVPARDGDAFLSFLAELRRGLKNKFFTIALPARTRTLKEDVYNYLSITPLVDRILVMAYDEHWSTSEPGPIASMDWCRRIALYSLETIGPEKLIMGLPFYGRSWGPNPNRAYLYSGIEDLKREQGILEAEREDGIPTFRYQTPTAVTVYYEDDLSLSARLAMYKDLGVRSVGFWRLGQETPAVWKFLDLHDPGGD
jgi:spore germination protein YaaH